MTVGEAVVSRLALVLDSSWLVDRGVDDESCCVLEGGDVLDGVLEGVELGVGVFDAEGVVEPGVDVGVGVEDGVDDGVEDGGVVEVPVELSVPVLSDPNERLNPAVRSDTTPPSSPPLSCRRRMLASSQFACAMAKTNANTDSSRR